MRTLIRSLILSVVIVFALVTVAPAATTYSTIQFRRDTAANWTLANPILDQGEPGIEYDTYKMKIGDGLTAWANLPYSGNIYGTSTTSITLGTGTQTFTTQTALAFAAGMSVTVTSTSDATKYMLGTVTSYSTTTGILVASITNSYGSGTLASWTIWLAGGPQGPAGPANSLSIGTVSTLTPGSAATATITGSAPNQTLNLGIPTGVSGTGAPPIGGGLLWFLAAAPSNYLFAQGQCISTTTYSTLYAVYGTTFNTADGCTTGTFGVPNMSGVFPLGSSGTYALGSTGGSATHTQTVLEMPSHNHALTDPGHYHYIVAPAGVGGGVPWGGGSASPGGAYNTSTSYTGITEALTGSGNAMNIMNPYLAVNWIIRYQ